jgi:two-component system nitrogen regulation sensor histidine kinase NtrY
VLVLIVGSELIRSSTEKWFSQPIEPVLGAATKLAQGYYRDRESSVASHAERIAREIPVAAVESGNLDAVRRVIEAEVAQGRVGLVEVYRSRSSAGPRAEVAARGGRVSGLPRAASARRRPSRRSSQAGPPGLRARAASTAAASSCRAGPVRDASGRVVGVVLASDHCRASPPSRPADHRGLPESQPAPALRRPIQGVYLTLFLMMTLMILVSATWTASYLAKRITRPVQRLAAGAREIGAGHLDHRIEPETRDEFGALVEAFNTMAGAASARQARTFRLDLERRTSSSTNVASIETVLERIATGVVSPGRMPDRDDQRRGAPPARGRRSVVGARVEDVCQREDLRRCRPA